MRKGRKEPGSNCNFLNSGIEGCNAENLVKLLNQESSSFQGGSVVNQGCKATHTNIVNAFFGTNRGQESNGTYRDKVVKIDNKKQYCEHKKPSWRQKNEESMLMQLKIFLFTLIANTTMKLLNMPARGGMSQRENIITITPAGTINGGKRKRLPH